MSDKFHVNLREARKLSGMTQKEVAEKVGIARSTYALYETGERSPDVEVVKKLAEVLNVSGDYLIGSKTVTMKACILLVYCLYITILIYLYLIRSISAPFRRVKGQILMQS